MIDLNLLKIADPKAIEQVYKTHKKAFMTFGSKYGLVEDELLDVYQDTIIALIENIRKGHLNNLQVELKTYLFSVGKYLIFKRMNSIKKTDTIIENLPKDFVWEDFDDEKEELLSKISTNLKLLGEQCYKILTLFYYEEKKLDEIQKTLKYENKDVLKSQKSRCLNHLKKLLNK
ncbi:sigma-70 family RNA polymerase sigma factor [Arcicella sp. DC2W]|uniref:Sigma-70 family RNA polymerase sigma factor n=1 Tax=Arcicella gelida TaxID=2984195 RepID=A0ABU5RYQ4_9BACT|nr:sigma-70 family RNA polymerase sigma factor [Arcicella sp. DC2W]MEA5401354.1 sigma-70 family RNA polymerase sigma factor [Arcicella sp. DC2W]